MSRFLVRIACFVLLAAAAGAEDRSFKECSACSEMVGIPAGRFVMGSPASEKDRKPDEGPQVEVKLEPFWMGKCEVTWEEYEQWGLGLDQERRQPA